MQNLVNLAGRAFTGFADLLPAPTVPFRPVKPVQSIAPIENPYREENNLTHLGRRIVTSLEDRWAIVGMTGSGKTTMAKQLLRRLKEAYPAARVYILDSKQADDFSDVPGLFVDTQESPDVLHTPGATQIWQPPDDDLEEYDQWFKRILRARQPAIVLVDETASLIRKKGDDAPEHYRKLNKLGRAFGIALVSLTQEAAYIPRTLLGQMTHAIRFRLLDDFDVRRLDKLVGRAKEEFGQDLPDPYGFIHRRVDKALSGNYYRNWQEFLGG